MGDAYSKLAALVIALAINTAFCTAKEQVLDARMHNLRSGDEREWAEFPEEAEGKT